MSCSSLSQTQWHRALLLTQLTAGIQDESIVPVLWLTRFLLYTRLFFLMAVLWACDHGRDWKGFLRVTHSSLAGVSLAHPGCPLHQSNRLQERWGGCQMRSNPMAKSTNNLANWSLIPNTGLDVHFSSVIVFWLGRENWKQETWVLPLP